MLAPFNSRFEEMDDEELKDLIDETDSPKYRQKLERELARRAQERKDNPPRPLRIALWVLGVFALLGILIAISASR